MCESKKYEKLEKKILDNYKEYGSSNGIPEDQMERMYITACEVFSDMVPGKGFNSLEEYYADKFNYLNTVLNSYVQVRLKLGDNYYDKNIR